MIAVFVVKSCDLLVDSYLSAKKSALMTANPADTKSASSDDNTPKEDNFDKSAKKIFSHFGSTINFRSITWATPLSGLGCAYLFGILKEPLRVVLTPPPCC